MKTQPIIDQLQAQKVLLKKVQGLAAFTLATAKLTVDRIAYVVPLNERFGPNRVGTGKIRQQEVDSIGVVIGMKSSDKTEDAGNDVLEALKDEVKAALVGFVHPDTKEYLVNHSGRILLATNGVVWWQQVFTGNNYFVKA